MAFHDEVLRDIIARRVPWRFKTKDLKTVPAQEPGYYRVGKAEYAQSTISTVPRNHSIRPDGTEPGDYVKKGRNPAFWWYGQGEYELILNRQHLLEDASLEDEELDANEGEGEELIVAKPPGVPGSRLSCDVDENLVNRLAGAESLDPAAIIVRYIAEKPFQAFHRRKAIGSVRHGWGERLAAYFWPSPDRDWKTTCRIVTKLSSQIQQTTNKLTMCAGDRIVAEELLTLFKETCVWGGVKLPESDASVLAAAVLDAWRALSHGKKPPSSCRLNSAWTKLYAFALPDTCVIYDSRVAAALTSILDPAMNLMSGWPKWQAYAGLGRIPGRGGSRPRHLGWDWPNGYTAWTSQTAANLLCGEVLKEINRQAMTRSDCQKLKDPNPWTLREVEAVLFMEGY
jgi:hypothetical protein